MSNAVKVKIENTQGGFVKIDDVAIIIESKSGIQKQAAMYSRGNTLYASLGSGFVALSSSKGSKKGTSSPGYKWIEIIPLNNECFEYSEPRVGYLGLK